MYFLTISIGAPPVVNVKYPKKQFNNDAHEIFSACCHGQWEAYCIQQLNNYLQKIEDRI